FLSPIKEFRTSFTVVYKKLMPGVRSKRKSKNSTSQRPKKNRVPRNPIKVTINNTKKKPRPVGRPGIRLSTVEKIKYKAYAVTAIGPNIRSPRKNTFKR